MRCGGYTLLFLLVACDSPVVQPGSGGSGTEGSTPSGGTSSTTTSGDSSGETGDSSTSTTTSSGGETDPGVDTCAFLCEEPSYGDCDLFVQDCPLGEKCVPYANDGGSSWNAWRCVPLDPDPAGIGEPCTVDGPPASGIDDCGVGVMCWDVDPRTEIGTCVPHCIGSIAEPTCQDPERLCSIGGDATLTLCLPHCDPVDLQTCAEGQACYGVDGGFTCVPDASGEDLGAFLDPCEYANACDPGLLCRSPSDVPSCGDSSCCVPLCDLTAPDCPDSLVCAPYFAPGHGAPGYEHVGICEDPR